LAELLRDSLGSAAGAGAAGVDLVTPLGLLAAWAAVAIGLAAATFRWE
jgi:hypothetical protein